VAASVGFRPEATLVWTATGTDHSSTASSWFFL
jgi:hypothetical protein